MLKEAQFFDVRNKRTRMFCTMATEKDILLTGEFEIRKDNPDVIHVTAEDAERRITLRFRINANKLALIEGNNQIATTDARNTDTSMINAFVSKRDGYVVIEPSNEFIPFVLRINETDLLEFFRRRNELIG